MAARIFQAVSTTMLCRLPRTYAPLPPTDLRRYAKGKVSDEEKRKWTFICIICHDHAESKDKTSYRFKTEKKLDDHYKESLEEGGHPNHIIPCPLCKNKLKTEKDLAFNHPHRCPVQHPEKYK